MHDVQAAGDPPLNSGPSPQDLPAPPADSGGAGGDGRRRVLLLLGVAVVVVALDVLTKALVVAHLRDGRVIQLLGGALILRQTRNSGAAFGIGTGATFVFSGVAIAVLVIISRVARRLRSAWWALALGLLIGGATGNLLDRLFRSPGVFRGRVVDWIDLRVWPVFNLADAAIVVGGILAVVLAARGIAVDGSRERR